MQPGRRRLLIGLGATGGAAALAVLARNVRPADPEPEAVVGDVGGEKSLYLQNPRVREVLRDTYRLMVTHTARGSMDMAQIDPGGKDFIWPANQAALDLFQEKYPGKARRTENVFNSPLVLYSWAEVADVLGRTGTVEQSGPSYFLDLDRLIALNQRGERWRDVGLTGNPHKVAVITSDPFKSSSGALYAALLASVLVSTPNDRQVANDGNLGTALPKIRAYFQDLGRLSDGSRDLFEQYKTQGPGSFPIIADYENLILELSQQPREKERLDVVKARLRLFYPRPTIWATHPLIALTEKGVRLTDALTQDQELRRIAWEQHGFRSGISGIQYDPRQLAELGLPETIQYTIPLPRPRVMQEILQATQ